MYETQYKYSAGKKLIKVVVEFIACVENEEEFEITLHFDNDTYIMEKLFIKREDITK